MKIFYDKIEEDILPLSTSFAFGEEDDRVDVRSFSFVPVSVSEA